MASDDRLDVEDFARDGGFGGNRLYGRLARELIGICRGLLMDGAVVDREVEELEAWCRTNPSAAREWPGNVLSHRVRRILADGHVDEEERRDLHLFLEEITGYQGGEQRAIPTIFTDPPPELHIIEQTFTLTGTFLYGPRRKVVEIIELIGGTALDHVSSRTEILLVGGRATPAWIEAGYGRKIEEVLERNAFAASAKGQRDQQPFIPIVSEEHWSKFVLKPE